MQVTTSFLAVGLILLSLLNLLASYLISSSAPNHTMRTTNALSSLFIAMAIGLTLAAAFLLNLEINLI